MKFISVFGLFFFIQQAVFSQKSNLDYVNPYIGTTGHVTGYGGVIPAVGPPFAMTQWSAMTRENKISACAYNYSDTTIIGFIGTHQPAIWMGDYGYVSLMPEVGKLEVDFNERAVPFRHSNEIATPCNYLVAFKNKNKKEITTQLSATERCAIFRFTFPGNDTAHIVVDAGRSKNFISWVKVVPERNMIIGYNPDRQSAYLGPPLKNFKGFFAIVFDQPFAGGYGTYYHGSPFDKNTEQYGNKCGAYVTFSTRTQHTVIAKVATSFISIEQALANLDTEIPDWEISKTVAQTKTAWNNYFNKIQVSGKSEDQKVNFYTALYHTLQYPRIFSEYGKYYSAFDDTVHSGVSYNDYSLWDTYRALHPWLIFIAPERVSPMVQSLLQMYKEGGWLPKWPNPSYTNIMIGTHADAVIADAFVKEFRDYDTRLAYEAILKDATVPPIGDEINNWADRAPWTFYEARGGLTYYQKLGYIPVDRTRESVSRTLEFAYDDFCVAQVAKGLGKADDYNLLMHRSKNYCNVFDTVSGFMRPRLSNGEFLRWKGNEGFTEGSPWTYLFCAVQDVPGLINLMGGDKPFIKKLDANFDSLHYAHSNEPGHHYIYLYNYTSEPWKTQKLLWQYTAANYRNAPNGLTGNDDCGQMSAWLIFTSMGFYPVCPGSEEYALGVPMFDKITLQFTAPLPEKTLTIQTKGLSETNKYVKEIYIDGIKHNSPFIKHNQLLKATHIVFVMDKKPLKKQDID